MTIAMKIEKLFQRYPKARKYGGNNFFLFRISPLGVPILGNAEAEYRESAGELRDLDEIFLRCHKRVIFLRGVASSL